MYFDIKTHFVPHKFILCMYIGLFQKCKKKCMRTNCNLPYKQLLKHTNIVIIYMYNFSMRPERINFIITEPGVYLKTNQIVLQRVYRQG